jgi:hypothetical protein
MKTRMLYKSQKIELMHTLWNREYNAFASEVKKSKKIEDKLFYAIML